MISPTRHSALHHGVRVSPVRATSTASAPFWRPWRRGAFGQIERVKGIARAGSGWVHFDVAGGRPSVTAFAAQEGEEGRVVAIDRTVNEARLRAAFEACAVPAVS
ncbi:MAG: GTP-binding protein [Stellaceae bacterium]